MLVMKATVLAQQDLFMEPEDERIETALREKARELGASQPLICTSWTKRV